jgi:hypothetical protein
VPLENETRPIDFLASYLPQEEAEIAPVGKVNFPEEGYL